MALNTYLQRNFLDSAHGGYFQTAVNAAQVPVRQKELYDGAVPSGNSVMLLNLLKLARITGDPSLQQEAERSSVFFGDRVERTPVNYTQFLSALDFAFGPGREIVIAGRGAKKRPKGCWPSSKLLIIRGRLTFSVRRLKKIRS